MAKKKSRDYTRWLSNLSQNSILGIDCSSSTIGWGLLSINQQKIGLTAYGFFKPLDAKISEIERLNNTYEKINLLCSTLQPKIVAIEDIFLYMKGQSQARTITILTAFNRTVGLSAYRSNKTVLFYTVHQIRKIIKEIYNVDNTIPKDGMPDIIRHYLHKDFEDIINNKGNVAKETFDEADGIAVGWACALHTIYPEKVGPLLESPPKKKRAKK